MEKINAILILEILGKPAEHIKEVLSNIIESLGKEKNVRIISSSVAEPKQVENEDAYTTFAEAEIETDMPSLMMVIFGYMPSYIEIIKPENLEIKNSDLNMFFNELVKKLHQYDEIARTVLIDRQNLSSQIKEGRIKVEKTLKIEGKKKKKC